MSRRIHCHCKKSRALAYQNVWYQYIDFSNHNESNKDRCPSDTVMLWSKPFQGNGSSVTHTSSFKLLTNRTQPVAPMVPASRIPAALRAVVAAAPGIWKPARGIPAAGTNQKTTSNLILWDQWKNLKQIHEGRECSTYLPLNIKMCTETKGKAKYRSTDNIINSKRKRELLLKNEEIPGWKLHTNLTYFSDHRCLSWSEENKCM